MNQDFTGIKVSRLSRKNSLKCPHTKSRNSNQHPSSTRSIHQHVRTSQSKITPRTISNRTRFSNVSVSRSSLSSKTTKTIITSKQNKTNSEEQKNQIITSANTEKNQSDLIDPETDFLPYNSITNSTTCLNTQRALSRKHRVTPINNQGQCKNEFTLDISERDRKKRKKKKYYTFLCKVGLCVGIMLLLIGGIIGALVYVIKRSQNSTESTTLSLLVTTTQNSACIPGATTCSTPMFLRNNSGSCNGPSLPFAYATCCYKAVSSQLTIEFRLLQEVSGWYIDDVSMTQGSGELIINGGFESNLTGWTIITTNALISPLTFFSIGGCKSGSACLISQSTITHSPDYVKQIVNVIPGQNVNISFWWSDDGGTGGSSDLCEATVTLTP